MELEKNRFLDLLYVYEKRLEKIRKIKEKFICLKYIK